MVRFASMLLAVICVGLGVWLYQTRVAQQPNANAVQNGNADAGNGRRKQGGGNRGGGGAATNGMQFGAASMPLIVPRKDPIDALAEAESAAVLDGWEKPTLAFVLTGEQHGYIEPCGCSEEQYGGMARRGDLITKMKDLGWEVVPIDLGGLVKRSGKQAEIKLEKTYEGLRQLGYRGVAMGPEELRLPDIILSQHNPHNDDGVAVAGQHLPFISSNLLMYDDAEIGAWLPFTVFEANGVKVGVTSVLSDSMAAKSLSKGQEDATIKQTNPVAGLKAATTAMDAKTPKIKVLLSHALIEETKGFLKEVPGFDVVVSAGGGEEGKLKVEMIGESTVLRVGQKGKHVGVLAYYADAPAEKRFRYELLKLDKDRFEDAKKMVTLMTTYQERLKSEQLANMAEGVPHPSGAKFVGAEKCGECHSEAFDVWKDSKHAHAFESLDPKHKLDGYERLKGIDRSFDPECISCHVTGWDPKQYYRFQSGFINEQYAATPEHKEAFQALRGTQCENCHGPGSLHIELIDNEDSKENPGPGRKSVRVTYDQAKDRTCNTCHDLDNSPKFDFETYWPQVKHGLDE